MNARLWDLFTETPSHILSGHKGWVLCVEWEGRERKLATGGHDGHVCRFGIPFSICTPDDTCPCCTQVRLWDPKTGKPIGDAMKGHTKWVTSLAWEPIHMSVNLSVVVSSLPTSTCKKRSRTTPCILIEGWNRTSLVYAHTASRVCPWRACRERERRSLGRGRSRRERGSLYRF